MARLGRGGVGTPAAIGTGRAAPGCAYVASGSAMTAVAALRNAPRRQAISSDHDTTATMIVEIALIWGVTPNLIEL